MNWKKGKNKAEDNGEFFFRYLSQKKPKGIKVYFAIDKNSEDYKRLKSFGNILDLKSNRYKRTFLESDKIISSISDEWVNNPFKEDKIYIRDLLHFDFIFLNNGILKNDLSSSLNRFDKNYSLIVISSKDEYKSIMNFNYGYNKNNLFLAGMPRFDYLPRYKNQKKENNIIIMPTFREINNKKTKFINHKSNNSYLLNFTYFYEFYNNLINSPQLLLVMKKYNYKGFLCLNHDFESNKNFIKNEYFSIIEKCDYKKLLLTASLFVIDYSNIFLELGYLKKPIIYAHFDYDQYKIINHQIEKFNYLRDGFGPICKDIECSIKEIIKNIENKSLFKNRYMKRIRKFFSFLDKKNNDRIFLEITNKIKEKKNKYNLMYIIIAILMYIFCYKFYIYIEKIYELND